MKIKITNLIAAISICILAGVIGAVFTTPSIEGWYSSLNKPSLSPPNFIFGPVWTTLYVLMGIALSIIWDKGIKKEKVKVAIKLFAIQLALNTLWSILFFGLHSPLLAFVEIVFLWIFILLTINSFRRISSVAALLLVPYILWVSFAAFLNLALILLN